MPISNLELRPTVLHVVESFSTGVLVGIVELTAALAGSSYRQVVLHARRPDTPLDVSALFESEVELVEWPAVRGIEPVKDFRAMRAYRAALKQYCPVLVHAHSSKAGFISRLTTPNAIPVAYEPHGFGFQSFSTGPRRSFYRFLEQIVGRCSSAMTLTQGGDERITAEQLGHKIVEVPKPLDLEAFTSKAQNTPTGSRLVVAMSGSLRDHKRPEMLARVAMRLPSMDFLWIGGVHPEFRAPTMPANVMITGWCERSELVTRLQHADMFMLLSLSEGLSRSVVEAMACGLPAVLSDVVGNRDLATSDTGNILADSEASVVAALRALAENPGIRAARGRKNRDWVETRFGREITRTSYLGLYAQLIERSKKYA